MSTISIFHPELALPGPSTAPPRATRRRSNKPYDLKRILAISAVLGMHVVLLGLLWLPTRMPEVTRPVTNEPIEVEIETVPPPKPPELPPKPVAPVRPPQTTPIRIELPVAPPAVQPPVHISVEPAEALAPPQPPTLPVTQTAAPQAQGSGEYVALRALRAPPPRYPINELRRGVQGVVTLRVLVDEEGNPEQVEVLRSSGSAALNREALKVVRTRWRFQAAIRDGKPVAVWGRVDIRFRLND